MQFVIAGTWSGAWCQSGRGTARGGVSFNLTRTFPVTDRVPAGMSTRWRTKRSRSYPVFEQAAYFADLNGSPDEAALLAMSERYGVSTPTCRWPLH